MTHTSSIRTLTIVIVMFLFAWIALAHVVQAQESSGDLRATIRAELLSDPRTSSLSQAQIEEMVDVLLQEAQKQGVTSHDIQWRPAPSADPAEDSGSAVACGNVPSILCAMNTAFGFDGSDLKIPIGLAASSILLIVLIGLMIEEHRRRAGAIARSL
ncbi:hypothetical protein A3H16_02645 [Candidatus Kaiserbacteria bacterium RIFCSPLOWO2_12_FULL_53_8]|uniref:Uncharacterized protein n=2 Tax=Candidatus Kaiseribacteriota TaxID=1752734 RepID=A0A1F6CYF4_9BACT|nr:MAG: hypothetical protein A2851_00840 [Candidatus Kaiserbacteria bacterium RIFCSPHIGHO2_01_FULL_53_29]OGG92064.1 MAG: hypothetical protein A3H16_02645 [Candidatus Kaiserbacteria bacterium RIFCSPLOWO2_12_FULL_53_8]